jgi:hypothetical protein
MLISWAPFILLVGFWTFLMWQMQTGRTDRSADDFARLLAQLAEAEELLAEARRIGTQTTVSLIRRAAEGKANQTDSSSRRPPMSSGYSWTSPVGRPTGPIAGFER